MNNDVQISYAGPFRQMSTAEACFSITVRDICANGFLNAPQKNNGDKEQDDITHINQQQEME